MNLWHEVSLGDNVSIKKAIFNKARKIIIAPIKHEIKFGGDFAEHIKESFYEKPLKQGDNLSIGILSEAIPFVVGETKPEGIVLVVGETSMEVREKPLGYDIDFDFSEEDVIKIKNLPELDDYLEVETKGDLKKVADSGYPVNRFEDDEKIVYLVGSYFFIEHKQ